MQAQSYAERHQAVQVENSAGRAGKESSGAETIFGLILALTALYGIGSVLAFLASYLIK